MRRFTQVFLVTNLVLLTAEGPAQARPLHERVLAYDQTAAFLETSLDEFFWALDVRAEAKSLSDDKNSQLVQFARQIYTKYNLYETFKEIYRQNISKATLQGVAKWLDTPLGTRLQRAHRKANEPGTETPIESYWTDTEISENRKNSIRTYFLTTGLMERHSAMKGGAFLGVFMGISGFSPAHSRDSFSYLKKKADRRENAFRGDALAKTLKRYVYLLRDFDDEELDRIAEFFMGTYGQAHLEAYNRALEKTLTQAAKSMRSTVVQKGTPSQ